MGIIFLHDIGGEESGGSEIVEMFRGLCDEVHRLIRPDSGQPGASYKTTTATEEISMLRPIKTASLMALAAVLLCVFTARPGLAMSAAEIDREVDAALNQLYATSPAASDLAKIAKAILVFPSIIKGGLIVGGQYGEGALVKGGKKVGYYNTVAASYGLQAGLQKFGYALFFTDEASLKYIDRSEGWELGVGPTIVIVDEGVARNLSTTTAKEGIYAFFFDQKGLMAGIGIQGTKVSRINP